MSDLTDKLAWYVKEELRKALDELDLGFIDVYLQGMFDQNEVDCWIDCDDETGDAFVLVGIGDATKAFPAQVNVNPRGTADNMRLQLAGLERLITALEAERQRFADAMAALNDGPV